MGQIARFPSRSGCKDGRVHTGGISIIYLQCGRVHLCSFLMLFSYCFLGLRRLCGVFASFFAHLCLRIKRSFSKGNFDWISFAVEAPPVSLLFHMGFHLHQNVPKPCILIYFHWIISTFSFTIWESIETGGPREQQNCKRNSNCCIFSRRFSVRWPVLKMIAYEK